MILRHVIEHFRKQEWTAIAIDFVIVVAGVFIGIQVSNLNSARSEAAAFESKLSAVRLEMSENLQRFEEACATLKRQFEDIARLRAILADPAETADETEIHHLLWQSVRAIGLHPKRNALDVVLAHELFSERVGRELVDEIEVWDAVLADMLREQRDELNFRDGFQNPYFAENLPLAAIFAQSADTRDVVVPARFAVTRAEMAENPVLENILVARQLSARQNFNNAGDLVWHTKQVLEKIEERQAGR
jgi:hypothetical protein